ncbi:MAG: hypothetical protein AB1714_29830 [Acidobacteriota bacterium]
MADAIEVNLMFPCADNDGAPFEEDVWEWQKDHLRVLFREGYTEHGTVRGWWQGYSDENVWYRVIIDGDFDLIAVREFLREACRRYCQEAMFLEYHPVSFELIREEGA